MVMHSNIHRAALKMKRHEDNVCWMLGASLSGGFHAVMRKAMANQVDRDCAALLSGWSASPVVVEGGQVDLTLTEQLARFRIFP
jgi:hypothetical protein